MILVVGGWVVVVVAVVIVGGGSCGCGCGCGCGYDYGLWGVEEMRLIIKSN